LRCKGGAGAVVQWCIGAEGCNYCNAKMVQVHRFIGAEVHRCRGGLQRCRGLGAAEVQ